MSDGDGRWLERFHRVDDVAGLFAILGEATRHARFDRFHFHLFPAKAGAAARPSLTDCPEDWRELLLPDAAALERSPLVHALKRVRPSCWSELMPFDPPWFARSRHLGLAIGVSFPVHDGQERASLLSLILRSGRRGERHPDFECMAFGQLTAVAAHEAFLRVFGGVRSRPGSRALLTDRERRCLVRAAAGETGRQIASTLGISEQTVVWHLRNARRKLDASTSREAYAKAYERGLLRPSNVPRALRIPGRDA